MWRQLCRRHIQLHLLLLLLSGLALLQLSFHLAPADDGADDVRHDDADDVRHSRHRPDAAAASRRVRRDVASEAAGRTVYVVTATYPRPEQEADLLRLAQTLMHAAPFVFWVLVEDAAKKTPVVTELLRRSGLRHVHLLGNPPPVSVNNKPTFWGRIPRGVSNRNTGLTWLRRHATEGVAYFADDDNTYDIRLFPELLKTRRVSVFPVGLVTEFGVSSPVVQDGRVVAFYDGWSGGRLFAMDMAGFAVTVQLLRQKPEAMMPFKAGYEEDGFLQALGVAPEDLEPLANNCTQILVWHTQTQKVAPAKNGFDDGLADTNIVHLLQHLDPGSVS